jgi:mono/diheme cytochrome c family protein
VARVSEATELEARLFAADADTGEVVAIDLPAGEVVARIATPPYVMQLGLGRDPRYLFAMRGRNTDRDFVTVIDTGIGSDSSQAQPPVIARTMLANTPGGIRVGRMASVGGRDAVFMEGSAKIVVMNNADYEALGAPQPTVYQLANPDHYHYLEAGGYLYIGHLRSGMVQILDRATGDEVGRIDNCKAAHGMHLDQATGRLFYACRGDTVIIGSRGEEANRELGRISYPTEQRAAAFQEARDRVLWAYTEGTLPSLYKLDLKKEPWAFEVLPVSRSIQQRVSHDGQYLLVLTRAGKLMIHDGGTGELIGQVVVSSPLEDDLHEHVDKAILPGIETLDGKAYITLPHEGRIVEVDVATAKVTRAIQTGGQPTRIVAVKRPVGMMARTVDTSAADGRWFEPAEVETGAQIYRLNCAVCHGAEAQGNFGGPYAADAPASAPPPLNGEWGSAEVGIEAMLAAINTGSDPTMPPFGNLLSEDEKLAVVAYYQSLWSDSAYAQWRTISNEPVRSASPAKPQGTGQHTHTDGSTHSHWE